MLQRHPSYDFFDTLTPRSLFSMCFGAVLLVASFAPSASAQVTPLGLAIADQTVPAGGTAQIQLFTTEPKPILKGGQRMGFSSKMLGPVQGMGAYSPAGDVSAVAVTSNGSQRSTSARPSLRWGRKLMTPC